MHTSGMDIDGISPQHTVHERNDLVLNLINFYAFMHLQFVHTTWKNKFPNPVSNQQSATSCKIIHNIMHACIIHSYIIGYRYSYNS